ncbi:MAG: hypothetical protein AAB674_00030 [Patescibacteria group bacterium]
MSGKKQREDDKKMICVVAYACLILNLDGHKQAARILTDNEIFMNEFKDYIFKRKKITAEMEKLLARLEKEIKKKKIHGR